MVRGARDPVAGGAWARRLVQAATDGQLVEIPRARHVVQHRRPGLTAAAIRRFAAQATAPRTG